MAEPYYKIDHAVCDPLDLWDREAMVYSALLYLCKLDPYKGSANKLRLFCKIKSKTTVLRILSLLEEKGLISRTPDGIIVNQYGSQVVHNGAVSNHSGAISKEKSNKKENKIKEIKGGGDMPPPPEYSDVLSFGKEKNIPESVCLGFFAYFTEFHWKHKNGELVDNWKATLVNWYLREKKNSAKSVYQSIYGRATEQEQATYAGAQYAEYQARKELEKQQEEKRQQNPETKYVTYEEFKKNLHN